MIATPAGALASTKVANDETAAAPDSRLDELLRQYDALLRRTIARVCPRELGLSCEDIAQDARVSLWKALKSEKEITFPVSYIYKVAVSATLRAIRRARARREEQLPEENATVPTPGVGGVMLETPSDASPHARAEQEELRRTIETGLAGLEEKRRIAVKLHLRGLTTSEIGDLLEWTEPKARNLVHRGLKDLRTSLRALGIDYGQ